MKSCGFVGGHIESVLISSPSLSRNALISLNDISSAIAILRHCCFDICRAGLLGHSPDGTSISRSACWVSRPVAGIVYLVHDMIRPISGKSFAGWFAK